MSFVRNFALGQEIAQRAIDTFRDARDRRDLGRIMDAKPQEIQGFTDADKAQFEAMRNAINPETGKPYYDVSSDGVGGVNVRNNFSFAGQDGQMVAPGSVVGLQPRQMTEFLGQRREGSFTPEQVEALRLRAMADVVSRGDPIAGLRMRREIGQEEREAERFGWDRQQQPLRQRGLELQLAGAERDERDGVRADTVQSIVDQALQIPQEQIGPQLIQYLNTNRSDLPLIVLRADKDGLQVAERNPVTGEIMPPFNLSYSVGRMLVAGMALEQAGKGAEALQLLSHVDDRITDIITRYNNQVLDVARFNNDVAQARFGRAMDEARLGLDRDRLGLQRRETDARINAAGRDRMEFVDDKGETVVLDLSRVPVAPDGRYQIPPGLRPKTARPDGAPGLAFNKLDDGGVFLDKRTGAPVGKLDPQLGIVPYGQDPRSDQRLLRTLQEKNIRIATGQTQDGLPTWVYITPSGRAFTTPEEALNPPIRQSDVEDLSGLRQLLDQTRAQLVAAGRSGDQRAIQPLARRVLELDRTLRAAARERFGERADEYLRGN